MYLYGTRQHGKGASRCAVIWHLAPLLYRDLIRLCQHFDRMQHRGGEAVPRHPLTELQNTARIPRDDELWLHRSQVCHFTVEEGLRGLGMEEVVNPSATATPIAFGDFKQCEGWDLAQQVPRLLTDFLAV